MVGVSDAEGTGVREQGAENRDQGSESRGQYIEEYSVVFGHDVFI